MPPRTLLSSEQRTRLFSIPTDPAEMARHYVLDADDLALVRSQAAREQPAGLRRSALRCFAIPAACWTRPSRRPQPMLAFVAQTDRRADPALFGEYAPPGPKPAASMRVELQRLPAPPELRSRRLARLPSGRHGRGMGHGSRRTHRPGDARPSAGERRPASGGGGAGANRVGRACPGAKEDLRGARGRACPIRSGIRSTGLLAVDPELRRSRFAWLRDYSESPAPSNIVALLDRLEYARGLGIDPARAGRIHAARLARLIDEGAIMTVQHIADLEPARRTAILVVQAASLETRLSDATLAMFEKYMGTLFSRARNRDERRFQATRRDVARALILFRRTIAALRHAKEAGEDGVAVVEREIGMKQLDGVLPVIGAVADVADQDILVTAAERYSVLRRFSPRFLAAFDFRSNTPNDPVLAAVELLRAMDRDGTRVLPKRPPSSFLPPQWRKLIFANGAADRRLYETAVLATLRERSERQQHLGRWQPRLSGVRGLPAARRSRAGHRHRRRDRSRTLHRQPHGGVARAPDLRGRARRARRTRRGRDRGRQTLHRPHPARRPRGRARSGPSAERNAASGADHRGSERCRWMDRIRRPVRASAHRQSRRRQTGAAGGGARRRHQSGPRPHGRRVARPRLPSPRQRGAMAHQRRQLRRRPRRHRQRAPQASDGGDLGRRDDLVVGRPVFPGRRPRRARAVPSTPNTASTPARCSTRTCPAVTDRSTRGSFRRR